MMNKSFHIIGKEAVDISLGMSFVKNQWETKVSFSQHVPYKIDRVQKTLTLEGSGDDGTQNYYGGGKFNISVSRYLN